MAKKEPGTGTGSASTTTYAYDELGRLTSVTYANGYSMAYLYDAAGNRTSARAGVGVAEEAPTPPLAMAEAALTPAPKAQAPRKPAAAKTPQKRAGAKPPQARPHFCTQCGASLKEGQRFCSNCGHRL